VRKHGAFALLYLEVFDADMGDASRVHPGFLDERTLLCPFPISDGVVFETDEETPNSDVCHGGGEAGVCIQLYCSRVCRKLRLSGLDWTG